MKVKKINERAIIPKKAYDCDAGFDVFHCDEDMIIAPNYRLQVKLGIAIEIEKDEVAIMSERSGMAIRHGLTSIGNIIDSGYRGEISIILYNMGIENVLIKYGDKIGQIIVCKLGSHEVEVVDELSETERGEKAHNSSGK